MAWRATITELDGEVHEFVSALPVQVHFLEENDCVLFRGEYDTVGMAIERLASFHIYEIGSYHSPLVPPA